MHTDFLAVHASSARVMRRLPSHIPRAKEQRKIVYLVRHAEAVHNVEEQRAQSEAKRLGKDVESARKNVLRDPALLDASLSAHGRNQVLEASSSFMNMLSRTHYSEPEIVFVSPLERTLQTAMLLFPEHGNLHALEFLREKRTGLPCDERKPARELKRLFRNIDFQDVEFTDAQNCEGFTYYPRLQESNEDVALRAAPLLDFLRCQPSEAVAIVTHKGFLRELNKGPWADILDLEDGLSSVFGNAEVRVCEVTWDMFGAPSIKACSLQQATLNPPMKISSHSQGSPSLGRQISALSEEGAPFGGGLFMAAGSSKLEDSQAAASEAWHNMQSQLGGAATFAIVYCHCSVDGEAVAAALRPLAGAAVAIGGSSTRGILSRHGHGLVGVLGFRGLAWQYALGGTSGATGAEARMAGRRAAQAATQGKSFDGKLQPDLIFLSVAPGQEEEVLEGIRDVCGDVPVFGGSTADDSVVGKSPNAVWWQIQGDLSAWKVHRDGVVLAALWLYGDTQVSCCLSHCFGPTENKGTITKASGRILQEIDERPAADVLNEWMGGALDEQLLIGEGLVQMETIFYPLAVKHRTEQGILPSQLWHKLLPARSREHGESNEVRLVHVRGIRRGGEVECYGTVEEGEVRLLQSAASDVYGTLLTLVRESVLRADFEVKGSVLNICAGYSSTLLDTDMHALVESLQQEISEVFCFFSFGEQGSINGIPCHGNLMINISLFG